MMGIWEVVTDFAIASALILVCKLVRANVVSIQRLFMPVALLAGLAGLALGPNGLDYLPFSDSYTSYGGLLIAIIFAAVGLATPFPSASVLIHRSGRLWAFNQTATVLQWLVAVVAGGFVFVKIWPELPLGFGLVMPAGFMGGHGTAVAIGNSFTTLGWSDALTLSLTSATFGVFAAVILGLAIIRYGVKKGYISGITPFEEMEEHHRKGLINAADRGSVGSETVSSSSIDVISMHAALILVVTGAAYYLSNHLSSFSQYVSVPTFAMAFLLGSCTRFLLNRTGLLKHFDAKLFNHAAGASTDYLIVFGIASIKMMLLVTYAVPFFTLMIIGLITCLFLVFFVAPGMLGDRWFEKGVFSWGWMTGTVAMGILLLRIADPDRKTKILDDYAIAYVPGAVVDILLISSMPALIMHGYMYPAIAVLLAYILCVQLINIFLLKRGGLPSGA